MKLCEPQGSFKVSKSNPSRELLVMERQKVNRMWSVSLCVLQQVTWRIAYRAFQQVPQNDSEAVLRREQRQKRVDFDIEN